MELGEKEIKKIIKEHFGDDELNIYFQRRFGKIVAVVEEVHNG